MQDICLIVDGNSLLFRAFHALPLMDVNGVYTNAVHGFLSMLLKAITDEQPRYCVVAFDESAPTFRHTVYAEYKAGRRATPEELKMQFPIIREILSAMGLGVLSVQGWEADDILGTVAKMCTARDVRAMLLTGDRDALQLVREGCDLLFTRKGITETILFDPATVREYFGVTPEQVTDWKGLMGDASDNIPGVPGVGEKTAVKLLNEYGTLENVLANAENIKGKLGEKIRDNKEQAVFSKQLATIRPEAPVQVDFASVTTDRLYNGLPALKKYHLNGIAGRVEKMGGTQAAAETAEVTEEPEIRFLEEEEPGTPEAVNAFLTACGDAEKAIYIAQDTITLACGEKCARIVLSMDMLSEGMDPAQAMEALRPLFEGSVVTHDGKRLLRLAKEAGMPLPEITFDTMLAEYLISPLQKNYGLREFAEENAKGVLNLKLKLEKQLEAAGMSKLFREIEMPLLKTLFDMESEGFHVNAAELKTLSARFTQEAEALKEQIYTLTGSHFNLNSPQQLGKVLFEDLGLPHGKKTAKGYSTDVDTLEKIQDEHPCVPLILRYRQVAKLNGTYTDALTRKMDAQGRVHSFFDQTGTATGRISSSEPNLQNIPVRTPLGAQIRKAFTAKEGCVLVDADYSQIELRVLAHLSGDPAMCDAFIKGQDVHTRTAAEVYGVALEDVTKEMRSASKAVNFGLVYGISEFGLSRNIGISRREAADFITRYFEKYPGIKKYMDQSVRSGYDTGAAVTIMGRRRALPELKASNANTRSFGERVAMNAPVQGSAADIIKLAMVKVEQALKEHGFRAKLILQVHDELIIEAPKEEAEQVAALLKQCMEQVVQLNVPLVAEVKYGESWYETK